MLRSLRVLNTPLSLAITLSAAGVLMITMGARQSLGLFVSPIHDSTGMGLVLAGNEKVYSNMIGGTRRADFAQLFSRVGRNLRLDRPTAEDVDAILKAWHIEGPKEREFCQQKASLPGALREMTKLLSAAAIAAHAMGGPIDIKVLRAAWREVGGSQ